MVTAEVINRVFFIKIEQYGTASVIDVGDKQYLVTSKHLLGGKNSINSIQYFHDDEWKSMDINVVGIARGTEDIAVFSPTIQLCRKDLPLVVGTKDIVLSQDVYFLGFPYKMRTEGGDALAGKPCPFIKKGILASLFRDGSQENLLYIDALNNEGFSGGPIVFKSHKTGKFAIAGIVSGYRTERENVICDEGEDTGWSVEYNTGITIGFDINVAVKLIENNPIGFELQT